MKTVLRAFGSLLALLALLVLKMPARMKPSESVGALNHQKFATAMTSNIALTNSKREIHFFKSYSKNDNITNINKIAAALTGFGKCYISDPARRRIYRNFRSERQTPDGWLICFLECLTMALLGCLTPGAFMPCALDFAENL